MIKIVFLLLFVVARSISANAASTVNGYLSGSDLTRFEKVFVDAFGGTDLQGLYYASMNMNPSEEKEKIELCKKIVELHHESKTTDYEKDYYLVGAHAHLKCNEKLPEHVVTRITNSLSTGLTATQEIYYKVASHTFLNLELSEANKGKIAKVLQDLLKKEDLATTGYAFNIASNLGSSGSFIIKRMEDTVAYADEVDGRLLQFEGGLSITSMIINGIFKISKEFNVPVPFSEDKVTKFANYFLSRRTVKTAKGAHLLIEALKTLSNAGKLTPLCIQTFGSPHIPSSMPILTIAIVDLMGKAFDPLPQNIHAKIINKADRSVLADNLLVSPKSSDKTVYSLDMRSVKFVKGHYIAEITVDDRHKQKLDFKVLGRVKVQNVEVGVADADGSTAPTKHAASYQDTLKATLKADNTQKMVLRAIFEDADTLKVITLHQVFVRLRNRNTDEEIIFIAEYDQNKAYKVEVDIGARSADFAYKSGEYELYLIVGDASISNSFKWLVAIIQLKFANEPKYETKKPILRQALPEIIHHFRAPEKRPSRLVSDIFTGLCVAPLILLFIFWGKLGINISNFTFAPSTIGFHLGFGGILTLFGIFWWKLNMFQTLRLLIPIAVFTFICGNRLLRRIYAQRVAGSKSTTS